MGDGLASNGGNRGLYWALSKRTVLACAVLALLCLLAYLPSLFLPLLEDDYANIWQAEHYGPLTGEPLLFQDGVARVRATVYWTIYLVWKFFRLAPWAFRASSLILHIFCVWLLYAICLAWPRMRATAFWAAAFFAVHEGHQEAIMWLSGNSELLQWLFGGASLLCWITVLRSQRREWLLQVTGVVLFVLALLSKESAFIFVPLFALVTPLKDWRRRSVSLLPYLILAAIAVISVALTRSHSFRFTDGSFSLHAPLWLTLPRNFVRVMWIWGVISAAFLFFTGVFTHAERAVRQSALLAMAWIAVALFPYSFLTYSPQIPSRQLYLASVGLSLLFGLGVVQARELIRGMPPLRQRLIVAAVMLVVVGHNVGYIWFKKQRQFLQRAEPSEELIRLARQTNGPILVECYPRHPYIAETTIYVALDRVPSNLFFSEAQLDGRKPAATFCYREH
jgi:hypothetical protein